MGATNQYQFRVVVQYDDFVVRDHRVHDIRVLPGVTYLDMIFRFMKSKGFTPEQVEVRNVLFKQPVVVTEAFDQRLQFTLEPSGEYWNLKVMSQRIRDGQVLGPEVTENMAAEVHITDQVLDRRIDLAEVMRQAPRHEDMETAYSFLRQAGITHYDVMKLRGKVHIGPDFVLGEVQLGEQARAYADQFHLHPTFLDGSTCVAVMLVNLLQEIPDTSKLKPSIPLYVESFRATRRYEEPSFVLIRQPKPLGQASRELHFVDIEVYNRQGEMVACFKRFGSHQIRHEGLISDLTSVGSIGSSSPGSQARQATQEKAVLVSSVPAEIGSGARVEGRAQSDAEMIADDLRALVARVMRKPVDAIDTESPFFDQGLDSKHLMELVNDLEQKLGQKLDPTLLFEYNTISALAGYFARQHAGTYPLTQGGAKTGPTLADVQPAGPGARDESITVQPMARSEAIAQDMRSLIARVMGTSAEAIDMDTQFFEQGLNSKHLMQLVDELEQKLGQKLYPTLLFEYNTIASLAGYFDQEFGNGYPLAAAYLPAVNPVVEPLVLIGERLPVGAQATVPGGRVAAIAQDLRSLVAHVLGKPEAEIDMEIQFFDQGLDSKHLMRLVDDLESKLGQKLSPTLLFEYNNIAHLAEHLETEFGSNYPLPAMAPAVAAALAPAAAAPAVAAALAPAAAAPAVAAAPALAAAPAIAHYLPHWVESPLPEMGTSSLPPAKRVFILYSPQARLMAKHLADRHADSQVWEVRLGKQTRKHPGNIWEIRADDGAALVNLLSEVAGIDTVYFLGGVGGDDQIDSPEALEKSQQLGVLSLFRLIASLRKKKQIGSLRRLLVVTNNVYAVQPQEQVRPFAAGLYGLASSLAKEYPQVHVRVVDISLSPASPGTTVLRELVTRVLAEFDQADSELVAIRQERRYIRKVQLLNLPASSQTAFRQNGVYLIAGGGGGLGLELALYLARTVQARIALVGRKPLNESQQAKIAEIEATGGQVLYTRADASVPEEMEQAVSACKERFGAIHGAIHAAVVLRDRFLESMDETLFREVTVPKVEGSLAFYRALRNEPLDMVLYFSSIASFMGNLGQSNYAAACAFEDAFAHRWSQEAPYPVKVINWGYWGSVGVASSVEENRRMKAIGMLSIEPPEGMDTIERLLAQPLSQVIPLKAENHLLARMGLGGQRPLSLTAAPGADSPNCDQSMPFADAQVELYDWNPSLDGLPLDALVNRWKDVRDGLQEPYTARAITGAELGALMAESGRRLRHLRVAASDGGRMEVLMAGNGPTLLLLPGFSLTAAQWYHQFRSWAGNYRVVSIHIPGIALSLGIQDVSLQGIARHMVETLSALGLHEPAHLIASSWGGMLAQVVAATYPDRVASLTMINSFARMTALSDENLRRDSSLCETPYYDFFQDSRWMNHECSRTVEKMLIPGLSTIDLLPLIKAPTLIVASARDGVVDPYESLALYYGIAGSKYEPLQVVGHAPNYTHPHLFNDKAMSFIRGV